MSQAKETKPEKKKGFLGRFLDNLDKKIEEKAKKSSCCGGDSGSKKGSSCC